MPKHIVDNDHSAGGAKGRMKAFTGIEKSKRPSEASVEAQRTERARAENARLKAFTKIERENG